MVGRQEGEDGCEKEEEEEEEVEEGEEEALRGRDEEKSKEVLGEGMRSSQEVRGQVT